MKPISTVGTPSTMNSHCQPASPATVDRLLHHAHICQTTGESVRLSQALAGQGVSPLG